MLKKKAKDLAIKDLRDCLDNNVILMKDLDQFHDQMGRIKGKFLLIDFSETTDIENGKISKSIEVQMEDYSGKISIDAFEAHAVLPNKLVTVDTEYYVSKRNDENTITASINNNGYKIKFEKV